MQTHPVAFFAFLPAVAGAIALGVVATTPTASALFTPYGAPVVAAREKGMVAADHYDASLAGAEVLARGGNAMDAAAATALALGVVAPAGSGLGGGGFLVYWDQKTKQAYALDFRETAPAAATRDMYLGSDGKAITEASRHGGLAVAIPAESVGLDFAEKKFGKAGLALAVQPAERLAREGFVVSQHQADAAAFMNGRISAGAMLDIIKPNGQPLTAGMILVRPALARTLHQLGERGSDALTKGPLADGILATVKHAGGILTNADLTNYRPIWREPLVGHFRGHTLYGIPPPGGGATAIEALNILDHGPPLAPLGAGSSAAHHAVAEALKHAFADRARWLGDPAFVNVPTAILLSDQYAVDRQHAIMPDKIQPNASYGSTTAGQATDPAAHDHGTSHVCVIDGEGNIASLTTTVNLPFGSGLLDAGSGIVLNDQMDDFAAQANTPNGFGLVGGSANSIAAGKRPLSSMNPMIIVQNGKPIACVGGSGGPKIVSATVQTIVNLLDHKLGLQAAVASPRIHAQWQPDRVQAEFEVPTDVVDGLKRRGHVVVRMIGNDNAAVQAIAIDNDILVGVSDPRKGGLPASPKTTATKK